MAWVSDMESVVLEREASRAEPSPDPAVRQHGDSFLTVMRSHDILGLLSERDLAALARQSPIKALPKPNTIWALCTITAGACAKTMPRR